MGLEEVIEGLLEGRGVTVGSGVAVAPGVGEAVASLPSSLLQAGKVVMTAHWGPAVSKNPYFAFKVKDAKPGDTIKVSWVDNTGLLLQLDGGLDDESMVLEGSLTGPRGESLQKITWTPQEDGSVRQHWTSSQDGGATWTTAFDGIYRKKN